VASGDLVFESVAQGEGIGVVGGSGSGPAPLGLTPDTVGGSDPAWSPTGQTIAFARTVNGSSDIWTMTAGGSNLKRLTTDGKDFTPDYSPLGERIVFASDRDGTFDIFVMDADGSHEHRLTSLGSDPAWSPDGSKIAFVRNHQIFTIPAGGGSVTQLTTGPGDPLRPAWSADGTQIAFDSKGDNPDNRDIYVVSANGTNLTRYTDTPHADASPTWDPTPGSEAIAYMRSSLQIVVASGALDHTPEVVTSGFDPDWENSVCAYGTSGDDQLTGGPNRPWLCGGLGDDTLTGGTEEDVLDGGDGADTLNARGGFINQLVGGPGSDDLVWGGSHGDDFDGGGSGGDKVSFNHVAGITRGVTVNLKTGKVTGACTCFIEHGTVEAVTGTRFKDTLVASDVGSSALAGLGGPDTFNACNGNEDQLNGGQQRDTARVEGGDHFNAVEVLHPC
jgi:Ca2+-binding RTX toxin-like protein